MEKKVSLNEVLQAAAKDYKIPDPARDSIWDKIQKQMNEPKNEEPQLFDGDYPSFDMTEAEIEALIS